MRRQEKPRILAIYLPQFYENEDNNCWWGKGFTDWDSVKTAESYFHGHQQPKMPLDKVYYDLSQKDVMEKQALLAKKYGIDGFCFYHYYFKNGKKELELPAENLLRWKDVDMPFCFNWASESWIRSWSRISGNVWAERYESLGKDIQNGILVEQDYGTYFDWMRHFEYLLPFFQDQRYIKYDGKPVFIFYSPNDIQSLKEMTSCWRTAAVKAGLPGLYLIGAHLDIPNDCLDAALIYEPRNSIHILNNEGKAKVNNGVRCFDAQNIWTAILKSVPAFGYRTYFCGVSGYDDTPRRGRSGEVIMGNTPQVFQQNIKRLLEQSIQYGNRYLFINAWNEWGEGMYLEPDMHSGYDYLEALKHAVDEMVIPQIWNVDAQYSDTVKNEISMLSYNVKKFKQLFQIIDKWLFLEQEENINFTTFFEKEKIKNVAIYGMSALGKHLLLQLRKEELSVVFGIDRYVGQCGEDFSIYRPEDIFPQVDAIIITSFDTIEITEQLRCKYYGKIFDLGLIIDDMFKNGHL